VKFGAEICRGDLCGVVTCVAAGNEKHNNKRHNRDNRRQRACLGRVYITNSNNNPSHVRIQSGRVTGEETPWVEALFLLSTSARDGMCGKTQQGLVTWLRHGWEDSAGYRDLAELSWMSSESV